MGVEPRDALISVDHVTKTFPVAYGIVAWLKHRGQPPRRAALDDVTLRVERGSCVGLLGPNGAGKSTLLKLLATLILPDGGRLTIDGIDVAADPLAAKRKVGLCANEERSFYYRLTARENLRFFGCLAGMRGAALERRIEEVIEIVDLGVSLDRRFGTYSSGMRQRLTVARALLGDPDVIFLDEPTRAVDPIHAEELRSFFRRVLVGQLGKTVILATNLLDEAWALCDRVAVLDGGRLVVEGPPQALDAQRHRCVRYGVGLAALDATLLDELRAIPGCVGVSVEREGTPCALEVRMEPGTLTLNALIHTLGRNGHVVTEFTTIEPEPYDLFAEITRGA